MEKSLLLLYLGVCSLQDIRKKEISISLLFSGLGIAAIYKLFQIPFDGKGILIGLFPGLCLLVFSWLSQESIGYGDGVIVLTIGLGFGAGVAFWLLWLALFFAGGFSMVCLIRKKCKKTSTYPFAPFFLLSWIVIWMGGFV